MIVCTYRLGTLRIRPLGGASREVVHRMEDAKNRAKDEIEEFGGHDTLHETNEMETPRNAAEVLVALDSPQNPARCGFGFEDGEDGRLYAIEHPRVDIIRCYGGDMYVLAAVVEFDTHGVAPTDDRPFAGGVNGHPWVGNHPRRRGDIADMPAVVGKHIGQGLQGKHHGRDGVDLHGEADVLNGLAVEGAVAAYNACAVDENIHTAAVALDLLVGGNDGIAVGDIDPIGAY